MKRYLLAAAILALTPAVTLAQSEQKDPSSLSNKATKDQPGATSGSGSTAAPTAKPSSGSLSDKAMKDQPAAKVPDVATACMNCSRVQPRIVATAAAAPKQPTVPVVCQKS